jgi:IS4 transposase
MDLELEDIIAIYDHRWQIELLFNNVFVEKNLVFSTKI